MTTDKTTGYWMFICNPKVWAIDKYLTTEFTLSGQFNISAFHADYIHTGHMGVIRVGIDKRNSTEREGRPKLDAGIYAIVQVVSEPHPRNTPRNHNFWSDNNEDGRDDLVVDIQYIANLIDAPILIEELRNLPEIDNDLISNRQASSWAIDAQTFQIIENIALQSTGEHRIHVPKIDTYRELQEINTQFQYSVPQIRKHLSKSIERGNIGDIVKKSNDYRCQICVALGDNGYSFQKPNGTYYIEAHHVASVSTLQEGVLSASNIITVCANHHRQLHYGNVELLSDETDLEFTFRIDDAVISVHKLTLDVDF